LGHSVFPYTTLFRSWPAAFAAQEEIWKRFRDPDAMRRKVLLLVRLDRVDEARVAVEQLRSGGSTLPYLLAAMVVLEATHDWAARSEEHTSELQSREN